MTQSQAAEITTLLVCIVFMLTVIMAFVIFHVIYQARHAMAARAAELRRKP
jgi:heme/copper-type cytochrome/quinol oxidase subunit 2